MKVSSFFNFLQSRKLSFPAVASLILLVLVSLIYYQHNLSQQSEVLSAHSQMTELPDDIKRSLDKTPVTQSIRVPVLLYHYVEYVKDPKDTMRKSLDIVPWIFERQVKTLVDDGYTFLTPSQIPDILKGKRPLPSKPVILSFDDGYRDFYTDVFPILKKYKVRVVAYIVPGFINKPNNLEDWQLKEISDSHLVEIGAHTMHHIYLKGMAISTAKYEIEESKKELETMLHVPVVSFAYPYGAFDKTTISLVQKAGFKTAVSTIPGVSISTQNQFYIYRIRPGVRTGTELLNFLSQNSYNRFAEAPNFSAHK